MKRLTLRRETVKTLNPLELGAAKGGAVKTYAPWNCASLQTCAGTAGCPTQVCVTAGACDTTTILLP